MFASDLKHSNESLENKFRRLYALSHNKKIDLSFRPPFLDLLIKLGDPHKNLPPVIHVAGTNGKGSIVATLKSILESGGYKVHAYTSPHLCEFNERIYLAGKNIKDDYLESLIDEALDLNGGADITFFEITTAIAFAAFSKVPADILLLETGMGGRLDSTNIIERPIVSVISAIGYDHVQYLGDNLKKIAGEKAGIIKRGVPCVIAPQSEEAMLEGVMDVFVKSAVQLDAPLLRAGAEWFSEAKSGQIHFEYKFGEKHVERILPLPALKGFHQTGNCGASLGALEIIADHFPLKDEERARGLENIFWPARLQNVSREFKHILPGGWELWLDGAHNESAAKVLSTQARAWHEKDGKPLHLLIGMMRHKDPLPFLKILTPHATSISFLDIPGELESYGAEELKKIAGGGKLYPSLESALKQTPTEQEGRILITGSLYLAGHVLKEARNKPHNKT